MALPYFDRRGLLPPGEHFATIAELRSSHLVVRPRDFGDWDEPWRRHLVDNLEMLVQKLWRVGITEIGIGGSFVEARARPEDIDGYFLLESKANQSRGLELLRRLNQHDERKIWVWNPEVRNSTGKAETAMRTYYRVDLRPDLTRARRVLVKQTLQSSPRFVPIQPGSLMAEILQIDRYGRPRGVVRITPPGRLSLVQE